MDTETDRQTDRQTDRETERETETYCMEERQGSGRDLTMRQCLPLDVHH